MYMRLVTVSLAAITASSGAFAQDGGGAQTPESAHRFLAAVLPDRYDLVDTEIGGTEVMTRYGSVEWDTDFCTTRLQTRMSSTGGAQIQLIRWRAMHEVRQTGTRVVVMNIRSTFRRTRTFDFGTEALAARAAYAMEFLRQHCDPTAGTGF